MVDDKNYSSRMYSDTIVLSGPDVMLSSSASVSQVQRVGGEG